MSDRGAWLRFERVGGTPPRDDEELRIATDGTFSARRTVGGLRIGAFGGRLSAKPMTRLQALVDALGSADDVALPTPGHGATETLEAAGRTLRLGSNAKPAPPWRALIDRARKLLEDEVVDSPQAAIELAADLHAARLVHAGTDPIDVDLGSVAVRVVRIGGDDVPTGRWSGSPPGRIEDGEQLPSSTNWVTAAAGWAASLPFDHGLALGAGDLLQVWVEVDIRDADGRHRGQLYARVPGGR